MYLIVGLGNPEPEYSRTRHNMGFDVINKLSQKYNIEVNKNGFKSLYGTGIIENEKVKPVTMGMGQTTSASFSSTDLLRPVAIIQIQAEE